MIDIEGLATGPETTILTIAAQAFDPLGTGYYQQQYYARVDLESQENRTIEQGTINWWATQPAAARDEAFNEVGRIPLDQALDELHKLCWKCNRIWMNGPTYDANILEHAYKSYGNPCLGNIIRSVMHERYISCIQGCPSRLPAIMRWKTAADRLTCYKQP